MKIVHTGRGQGKTLAVIEAAFENRPSVIAVSDMSSRDFIKDKVNHKWASKTDPIYVKNPGVDVVLFKDLPEYMIGRRHRNIYIDDLDDCLTIYTSKHINLASIDYSKPCKDNLMLEDDEDCPGRHHYLDGHLLTECRFCPYISKEVLQK